VTERRPTTDRAPVVIVGGGPAGSLLALLLHHAGIESVVLELRSREHVLNRVRAGVIEHGSADLLRSLGLGDRMDVEGNRHEGVNLAFGGQMLRIDFTGLTGRHVVVYGQAELQKDFYTAIDAAGVTLIDGVEEVSLAGSETTSPTVSYVKNGIPHTVSCDFVVGCDGAHGITRRYVPAHRRVAYEREYPFVWVGLLSDTPPVREELIYANHERGFALCSMRNLHRSRYYVQGLAGDRVEDWPDQRFWHELKTRLPEGPAGDLVTGPSLEKLVTPLRSWVSEPMSHGRLFLAGDVAHVVPPTGAKGLNLAISDVFYLSEALVGFYSTGSSAGLEEYSSTALRRVWKAVRFSWWMTMMMHRFPATSQDFDRKLQTTELEFLFSSESAQRVMAEQYTGLPF
jgi:p-hydroxybenzoate 3-monooxygenase